MTRIFKPSWFNDQHENPVGVRQEAKRYGPSVRLSRPLSPVPRGERTERPRLRRNGGSSFRTRA